MKKTSITTDKTPGAKAPGNKPRKGRRKTESKLDESRLSALGKWLNDPNAEPIIKIVDMRAVLK